MVLAPKGAPKKDPSKCKANEFHLYRQTLRVGECTCFAIICRDLPKKVKKWQQKAHFFKSTMYGSGICGVHTLAAD